MLVIETRNLKRGVHEISFEPEAEMMDLEPERFRSIVIAAEVQVGRDRIVVRLRSKALARLVCDRTLNEFDQEIEGSYVALCLEEVDDADDEEIDDVLIVHDGQVDISRAARDTVLLSVPVRCVAPEAAELDIETRFGVDELDVDPRWEALRQLTNRAEPEDGNEADATTGS